MICCITAPSHYLNQSWLIIWHQSEDNFTGNPEDIYFWYDFENELFQLTVTSPIGKWVNTLRPRQNGRYVADNTFKRVFLKENVRISIKISLKFVPKGPIDNIPALFQIMAWCQPGDKPLSEAVMVNLLTHICVARPQWVNCYISRACVTNAKRLLTKSFYQKPWPWLADVKTSANHGHYFC